MTDIDFVLNNLLIVKLTDDEKAYVKSIMTQEVIGNQNRMMTVSSIGTVTPEHTNKYHPYRTPHRQYTDDEIETMVKQVKNSVGEGEGEGVGEREGMVFHLTHPYYRNLVRKQATENGLESWSYTDYDREIEDDSELIYHYKCRKSAPTDLFHWITDPNSFMIYSGSYSKCPNCDGTVHNYYTKGSTFFDIYNPQSYKIVQGKNCLFIGTEKQVKQHQHQTRHKTKEWNIRMRKL